MNFHEHCQLLLLDTLYFCNLKLFHLESEHFLRKLRLKLFEKSWN